MLSLYPHNETAYQATMEMLAETGKATVIHPTGTGKSMIAFKLCEDHPGERVLWLGPSTYIYKTQVENLQKVIGGKNSKKAVEKITKDLTFHTYAKLMLMTEAEMKALSPAYIIFDEFHRAGAESWGGAVQRLLSLYPDVPLVGLSATNIRYLDGQRDMAEELFDGNVASEISLGEAIVRGILAPPEYICSVYSYSKSLEKYAQRVRNAKSKAVRDKAKDLLDQLRRTLEQAEGLSVLFQKHMKQPHGKYIVFCSDKEHMDEMLHISHDWFSLVDKAPHFYSVYADDPETDQAFADFKSDSSDHLRLLFCIDMLNEGVHVDDIDGVILLRPTISPIVYKQQIGRALSAGKKKEAIIFDIVLNIENLCSIDSIEEEMQTAVAYYRRLDRDDQIVNEHFQISGQIRDCMELFSKLGDTLGASWDFMYEEAKKYYETYGNLNVAKRYVTETGYNLGTWILTQRKVKTGEVYGRLSDEQIQMLTDIGMRWESASDSRWNRYYKALVEFKEQYGDIIVPKTYITQGGLMLGNWIANLRNTRKSGLYSSFLTEERIAILDGMGMVWDATDYLFERNFAALVEYHRRNGNVEVPVKYVSSNGVRLGAWISYLKQQRKKGSLNLTDRQIQRLDALGMLWGTKYENAWEAAYQEAVRYWKRFGNLDVPTLFVTETGFKLGRWIHRQRDFERNGKLSEDRKNRLNQIDQSWKVGA